MASRRPDWSTDLIEVDWPLHQIRNDVCRFPTVRSVHDFRIINKKKKKGRRRRIDTYTVEKKFKKKRKVKDKEKNVNLLSSRSKGWY